MSETTGYILSALLVLLVVRQLKWNTLKVRDLARPIIIVGAVVATYLTTIPTAGNDVALELLGAGVGGALGIGCALTTSMRREGNGRVAFRSGTVAAILWIAGAVARSAFSLYANNGGGIHIARFSAAHSITTDDAWTAALILMAIVEVVARTAVIGIRARRAGWGVHEVGTAVTADTRVLQTAAWSH